MQAQINGVRASPAGEGRTEKTAQEPTRTSSMFDIYVLLGLRLGKIFSNKLLIVASPLFPLFLLEG